MKRHGFRTAAAGILCLTLMLSLLCGCGDTEEEPADIVIPEAAATEAPVQTPAPVPEASPEPVSTATSAEAQLYLSGGEVVNAYGENCAGYSVDVDGNIRDEGGKIVVAAANTGEYIYIERISPDVLSLDISLRAVEEPLDANNPDILTVRQYPVSALIEIRTEPADPVNSVVTVRSSDSSVAALSGNLNKDILADEAAVPDLDPLDLAVVPDGDGIIRLRVTALSKGTAILRLSALAGNAEAEIQIRVLNGTVKPEVDADRYTDTVNASGDATKHVHSYTGQTVAATVTERGYTLFTCTVCGYSYRDMFTPMLPAENGEGEHVHVYAVTVVPPTETGPGYTLHECVCGDSYKDCFTTPAG